MQLAPIAPWRALLVLSLVLTAIGCPSDDEGSDAGSSDHHDGGPRYRVIPCPDDLPELRIGLEAEGDSGNLRASLVDAVHLPAVLFTNDWTIEVQDADGTPLDDVEITMARTFMPAHNHDGTFAPTVTALEAPGQFQLDDLNLWMLGPWEVQLSVRSESAGDDYIVFPVCVR